jgi:hypothetical protein
MESKMEMPAIITDPNVGVAMVMSVDEYREWSKSQGRIMGRLPNQVTMPSEEEMRIMVKSGYTRAMIKEKHGLSDAQIDERLKAMSFKEGLDRVVVLH